MSKKIISVGRIEIIDTHTHKKRNHKKAQFNSEKEEKEKT